MKALTLLCLWLSIPLSIQAQAILEHTYPTTDLHRVYWTLGGEHYWFSNDSLKEIKVYSAQHRLEKTIRYPSVLNSQVRLLRSEHAVTETHINGDDLLEMLWYIRDTVSKKEQLQIRNERDSTLFIVPTRPNLVYFSEIEGLPTKLMIATNENGLRTTVYNVPNIRVDTIYLNAYYLRRKKFGYAGEKYFYINNDSMRFFNANHSQWKKPINLKWSKTIQVCSYDPYTDADDNVFSKDPLIEVMFSYKPITGEGHMIINELGTKIYKSNDSFRLDHQKGLSDLLFFDTTYSNTGYHYHRIYNLPSFQRELKTTKTSYPWQRTVLKKYGESIFTTKTGNTITLFFNNYTNSKTVNLPTRFGVNYPFNFLPQEGFPIISDSIINKDTLIEVIYAEFDYNNQKYTTKIINEAGTIYNTIDSTRYFSINQSPTLSPKLITKTGNDKPYDTKVWRFNTTTPTKEAPSVLEAKIYPNPFTQSITIELSEEDAVFPLTLRLTNTLGQVVWATKTHQSKIEVALPNLVKGMYFLEITDGNKRTVRELVKVDF